MSEFVKHEPCPACGSKDNMARWSDGHTFCFGCGYRQSANDDEGYIMEQQSTVQVKGFNSAIPERNISKNIATKYGVRVTHGEDGKINKHYYPYYDAKTSDLLGFKERDVKSRFRSQWN